MKLVRITMPAGDWMGGISRKIVSTDENYPPIVSEPLPSYFTKKTGKNTIHS